MGFEDSFFQGIIIAYHLRSSVGRPRYRMAEALTPTGVQENWRRVYLDVPQAEEEVARAPQRG